MSFVVPTSLKMPLLVDGLAETRLVHVFVWLCPGAAQHYSPTLYDRGAMVDTFIWECVSLAPPEKECAEG